MRRNYESTRNQEIKCLASEAVVKGIALDGGLFVRNDIEDLELDLKDLLNKSYIDIAKVILSKMLDDYEKNEIDELVEKAYIGKFSNEEITPVKKVGEDFVVELFHGPTSAFKDIALSLLPHLLKKSLEKNNIKEEVLILTATSGDTGKAALEGFKDVPGIKILVIYPNDGVSKVQEKQMRSQEGSNTFVYAINGNFDDAQSQVKKIFTDNDIKEELLEKQVRLSSANSINIGRLVPQMVYYFYSYMKLVNLNEITFGEKINFTVPTGNFGDILAGYYAKLLGLPINRLICASNENNILCDFIKTGTYDKNREFYKTISPSMDILISSNLERLLYHMSGNENKYIDNLMKDLKNKGKYEISGDVRNNIREIFRGGYSTDEETKAEIKKIYEKYSYVLDPHTAVAFNVMEKNREEGYKNVVLATASPYKFSKSVYEAIFQDEIDGDVEVDEFEIMERLHERTEVKIPENLKNLKDKEDIHTSVIDKDKIMDCFEVIL
ncbi:threonine synthase [Fusobacterium sp. MFO224]|uniref:threonine synthase n=1 Tax=Fusobacterium sp. MFO224 TaxID=3378070 RepID=UPI00385489BA